MRLGEDEWKRRVKTYNLKKYGITINEYDEMLVQQNGLCAICEGQSGTIKGFHVDHDHDTDQVRGLLCHSCNQAMVAVDRVSDWPERASAYKAKFRRN